MPHDLYIGLDIGGTKLLAASADRQGHIRTRERELTPVGVSEGLETLHRMIAIVAGGSPITAMGAAIGGPLDWRRGIVSPLHQPEWRDIPLKSIMEERWGCTFTVDVDTNVAALGEYHFGGERAARLLYLTLSTGMGGGFLTDGRIYRGMAEGHPEVAHHSVNYQCRHPERIACECGAPDCLEALVSGNGIRRVYGKPPEDLTPEEWAEVAFNLGQGLRNLAAIYLPDLIVFGGGLAIGTGEHLLPAAASVMRERCRIVAAPAVRLSRLGYETALMGALAAAIYGVE